jgi:para-aminobenzoate synthetase component 1
VQQFDNISLQEYPFIKESILEFSSRFKYTSLLQSNEYPDSYGKYEFLAAIGAERVLCSNENSFEQLRAFYEAKSSWLFGHLSYDLKNQLEKLQSKNPETIGFDDLCFFEPKYLFLQKRGEKKVEVFLSQRSDESEITELLEKSGKASKAVSSKLPAFSARQSREEYITAIQKLKSEIQYGNIYEINYCTEFYITNLTISPVSLFQKLNAISPMPFSAFYKNQENYLMCASPERYVTKTGDKIISQPIKGTMKRGADAEEDAMGKELLKEDLKEQTENVMIVDLVRNDLSRTAAKSSVKVEELFGVYTFPQVHQLISTISSRLKEGIHCLDAIKFSFPMGSMTGAPKIAAMQLADQLEKSKRELYSGSVGYIDPNGDFDFNVVIRSLIYNEKEKYLSLMVGGAITNLSDPLKEYEECLLKAKAIFEL